MSRQVNSTHVAGVEKRKKKRREKSPFSKLSICSLVNEVRLRCNLRFSRRRAWSSSDGVVVVGVGGADREFSPELPSSERSSPEIEHFNVIRHQIFVIE